MTDARISLKQALALGDLDEALPLDVEEGVRLDVERAVEEGDWSPV